MKVYWRNQDTKEAQIYKCIFENKYVTKIRKDRYSREFVLKNMAALIKGKYTLLDSPIWVGVKLTNYCNLSCRHCWTNNDGYIPSKENIFKMIDRLYAERVKFIGLSGGEIFTRKDIFDILSYIKEKKMIVELFTNGTLIGRNCAEKLETILDKKVDVIQVSLDGITEKALYYQRGLDNATDLLTNIKGLIDKEFIVRISFVATQANISDMYSTFKLMDKMGASGFSVSAVYPKFKGIKEHKRFEMSAYYKELYKCINVEHKIELQYFLQIDFFEIMSKYIENIEIEENERFAFEGGFASWFINAEGNVYPEFHLTYEEFCGGNIYAESLDNIINRFKHNKILVNGRNLENEECKNCIFKRLCMNHSYEQSYEKYKTFNAKNPYCQLERT